MRSQSGAFDLPSIITGVVVVGILTAGVLAAIFGVIPYTQDRAAKQDLAAINTAQGVTYAKDGQTYKDIDGLSRAALLSGLDPETTEIRVPADGKGFTAITNSKTGTRWYITHDDNVPRIWEEQDSSDGSPGEAEAVWATGRCTPLVRDYTEYLLAVNDHQGAFEMEKEFAGLPADTSLIDAWEKHTRELKTPDLSAVSADEAFIVNVFQVRVARGMQSAVEDSSRWPQWKEVAFGDIRSGFKTFCDTYQGPLSFVNLTSGIQAEPVEMSSGYALDAAKGSTEPLVVGFPYAYNPDLFEISANVSSGEPGSFGALKVDGKQYMAFTMAAPEGGWDSGIVYVDFEIKAKSGDMTFYSSLMVRTE